MGRARVEFGSASVAMEQGGPFAVWERVGSSAISLISDRAGWHGVRVAPSYLCWRIGGFDVESWVMSSDGVETAGRFRKSRLENWSYL